MVEEDAEDDEGEDVDAGLEEDVEEGVDPTLELVSVSDWDLGVGRLVVVPRLEMLVVVVASRKDKSTVTFMNCLYPSKKHQSHIFLHNVYLYIIAICM